MEFLGKNKKGGRPAFKPSKTMRNQVEIGAAAGLSHSQIAAVLGISRQTLENNFDDELKNGRVRKLVQSLLSLDRAQKRGSVAAAKFLVNAFNNGVPLQRMGKKERTRLEAENALANSPWADIIRTPKQAVE
jgi:hypothetical protein